MSKFLKNTWPALIMILFAILNEFIMSWLNCQFKNDITWGDVLYHGVIKLGYLSLLPALVLFLKEENKSAKLMYLGLIFWNIKEILDRLYYVAENKLSFINENLFFSVTKNDIGFTFQLFNIILVVVFGLLACLRCIYFFRFLAHLYWPFCYASRCIKNKLIKKL